MVKIVIVDDCKVFRLYLSELLGKLSYTKIAGLAENGKIGVELVQKVKPDVVLMDIKMPVMNGFEATRKIKEKFPNTEVIAFSSCFEKEMIDKMLEAGASKYLIKGDSSKKIVEAIKEINNLIFSN